MSVGYQWENMLELHKIVHVIGRNIIIKYKSGLINVIKLRNVKIIRKAVSEERHKNICYY